MRWKIVMVVKKVGVWKEGAMIYFVLPLQKRRDCGKP
jgi:hypothetical protein